MTVHRRVVPQRRNEEAAQSRAVSAPQLTASVADASGSTGYRARPVCAIVNADAPSYWLAKCGRDGQIEDGDRLTRAEFVGLKACLAQMRGMAVDPHPRSEDHEGEEAK